MQTWRALASEMPNADPLQNKKHLLYLFVVKVKKTL
jgi:hypothetical protein